MSWQLKTPVSVFFYRRPDHLREVMDKVREARPPVLFGISDGPKQANPEIQKGVEESRKVFRKSIDWPCRWELLERETNLGSYLSVSQGLDWVFARVGETIVLEDDTVPDPTFFRFVAELLQKYRDEPKVGAICGNNYDDPGDWPGPGSYRFTRYHHSWGWGTWKRAWACFDREERLLAEVPVLKKENWMKLSRREWAYWERCFQRTYAKKLDAWDYRWTLSLWRNHLICIVPRTNLVRNIGFDSHATHTVEKNFADLKMHQIESMKFPLTPPQKKSLNKLDDKVFFSHYEKLEGRRTLFVKLWHRLKKIKSKLRRSSISDTDSYREACLQAATNQSAFANFKKNRHYKEILEHTTYETGLLYLNLIKQNKIIFEKLGLLSQNDNFGGAETYLFPEIKNISPSTLRYVKVLKDLVEKFKNLENLNISEIGGGYGGQCLIIQLFAKSKKYQIFDLEEALLLAEKYLIKNNVFNIQYLTLDKFVAESKSYGSGPDLIISNYAFSEIQKKIQKKYLDHIILKSKMGYLTYNSISSSCGIDSFSISEIKKQLENKGPVFVEDENPLTFKGNQILWWNWN